MALQTKKQYITFEIILNKHHSLAFQFYIRSEIGFDNFKWNTFDQ